MIKCILILSLIANCVNYSETVFQTNEPSRSHKTNNQNNKLCNVLVNQFTFSSLIRYCESITRTGNKNGNGSCYLIEENVIDGERGKLIRKSLSDQTQIYYRNDFPEQVIIDNDNTSKRQKITDLNNLDLFIYNKAKRLIIGPSSVIVQAANSNTNQLIYEGPIQTDGIDGYSCATKLNRFMKFSNIEVRIFFQDPDSLLSKSETNKILKLQLNNSFLGLREFHYLNLVVDEPSIWRMPGIGAALNSRKRNLPKFVGTGMHEIVLEYLTDEDKVETIDLYFNRKEQLLRIDDTESDVKLIYNAQTRSIYNIKDGLCKMSLVKKDTNLPENIKHLFKLLDHIENSNKIVYNYLGQEIIGHVICDVFEFSSIDQETNDKTVRLIYVRHQTDLEDEINSFPMRVSEFVYELDNGKYKIGSKSIYNLLNYQQLYYDQYYRDLFQTKYCHSDLKDNLYLTILAQSDEFKESFLLTEQHINQLKDDINQLLRDLTNLTYLQIPDLFIEFKAPEIKIEVIFEELVKKSDYFEPFTDHWIPFNQLDLRSFEESTEKCAKRALNNETIYGYTYCEHSTECYLIDDQSLFKDGDKKKIANEHCHIKRKIIDKSVLNLVLIQDAYLKLKNQIDSEKIELDTTLFNNGKEQKIKFNIRTIYETFRLDILKNRAPFIKHRIKQKLPEKQIKHRSRTKTIQECYLNCREKECTYFNICHDESTSSKYVCELGDLKSDDLNKLDLINDNQCNIFEMNNLNLFDKYEESRFLNEPLERLSVNLNDCATKCLNRKDQKCKSIVYFDNGTNFNCELTDQHMEIKLNRIDHQKNFTIYSINYLEDYHQTSVRATNDNKEATISTIKGCAVNCIQLNTSISFNFCPLSTDNINHLGHCHCVHENDDPISDELPWECVSLQKNLYSNTNSFFSSIQSNSSFSTKSNKINGLTFSKVTEISFLLFFIGILVGSIAFITNRKIRLVPSKRFLYSVRYRKQKKSILDDMDEY